MLESQLYKISTRTTPIASSPTLLLCHNNPFLFGGRVSFPNLQKVNVGERNKNFGVSHVAKSNMKPAVTLFTKMKTEITVTIGVRQIVGVGQCFPLELVAAELDRSTGSKKETIKACARRTGWPDGKEHDIIYKCKVEVGSDFGEIGGVIVENENEKEMFISYIKLEGSPNGTLNFICNSWVDSKHQNHQNPDKRIFFTSKSYLPSNTPTGLRRYRESELVAKRGDGTGKRVESDRIYDYDVYNDLGDPDHGEANARPILGGKHRPYPRRCRTGRPPTQQDPLSESLAESSVYVPRDEQFSKVKSATFNLETINKTVMTMLSELGVKLTDDPEFSNFNAIDNLYREGATLINNVPRLFQKTPTTKDVIFFETPEILLRDKFKWMTDEEFGRQTLAGPNPFFIQLVTTNYLQERLIKSKLDTHKEHQPCESAITREMVEQVIRDYESVEEAVAAKKLFVIDYLDLLLPYVNKVRELKGTTLYGSRALFYLTPLGTLRPIAIELVRPPARNGKPLWKEAYCPGSDSTSALLWKLAKTHFLAHDSAFHQLVSHWLRTHCATEPYIIATNRQLSDLHPIYRLLHPHFRYTMEINAQARQNLINSGGFIESTFSPGKYSIELSSVAYDKLWYFDKQGLPDDLISRGMAEKDPDAPHGLRLTIEDYPYASDGLILWDCIKQWVSDYVNHYYPKPTLVESDQELQEWWTEIRTVGHADKKDDRGWLPLKTPQDLIKILTIIIWVTSAHHAAVNFGQYDYAGYFPNRPTIARVKMPSEDPTVESWKTFELRQEDELLSCFPTQIQAVKVIAVLDVLANHSDDEEYIGGAPEPAWKDNPKINEAFEKFSKRLKELEGIIDARNIDEKLRNRTGNGVVPYKLLKPTSKSGVTGQGVPNSISI